MNDWTEKQYEHMKAVVYRELRMKNDYDVYLPLEDETMKNRSGSRSLVDNF
jgi:hypothetical protein